LRNVFFSEIFPSYRGRFSCWRRFLSCSTFWSISCKASSIHAFGESTVGGWFLGLIAVVLAGSTALIVSRLDDLRSERRIDSLLSRESIFLLNNLALVGLWFVIFWGTFFPLISEAVTGDKASVGPPWFDRYTVPLALMLVLLSGVGPLLAWRRVSRESVRRLFAGPVAVAGAVIGVLLLFTDSADSPLSLAMFSCASFAIAAVLSEYARAVRTQRSVSGEWHGAALAAVIRRNRRRYGGYLVHLGVAVLMEHGVTARDDS